MTDEAGFRSRMYVYHCRLVASYNEKEVVSLAVLADDNPRWRPDSFVYERWGMEVGFCFPVVKLLDDTERRTQLEQSENPFVAVVLAHLDTQETRQDLRQRKDRKFSLATFGAKLGCRASAAAFQLNQLVDGIAERPENRVSRAGKQLREGEAQAFH